MEAASLFAVARFRRVKLGILLYRADDVSGKDWDPAGLRGLYRLRERAFQLAAEACLRMSERAL
jgi:hypothetical protein